jgi:hypothetical protein
MDKVLVLEDGNQSEYGSPEELAAAGGFFSRMAALQRLDSDKGLVQKLKFPHNSGIIKGE